LPPRTDQWKDGGDCTICRRAGYCKRPCKHRKRWIKRAIDLIHKQAEMAKALALQEQARGDDAGGE